ncbi:tyrosine-type recombinase/integrase [Tautonia plasticadhaerens]|uniref:Site-specific tyrosine recombinase XerC n=1 Tax=Tautonia plasticadhaerens TaxID=2527974 RepID=A0A518H697_9BACT|nr:tyrosine-type recombinase/integrase [Tautonia plasticadhaerens]QDV36365.1 site-specific tyrosine recombinase XerC [Tautonia plasticadhaerens]
MPVRIPSYRLHRPSGQAVVTLAGKDHYLGKHGSTESRQEYRRLVSEWLARPAPGPPPGPAGRPDLTINELLLAYWDHARSYYVKEGRPTSEVATIRQALRPVRELYGETPAVDFGPLALKAVRQAMIDRGWCRGYINKQVNRIRRAFTWAAENELLPVSSHQALCSVSGLREGRSGARERPPIGPVSDADFERTLSLLPPTVAAMARLQRLTGMRPQEIVMMRGAEVDTSDPDCWVYLPGRHKGQHHGRDRVVYLGPRARELLRPFLDEEPVGYLFSPRRAEARRREGLRARRRSPLTPSQRARAPKADPAREAGDHYQVASYRRAIRRACGRLGLTVWFPHQLRHAAASEIRRRYGLEASQAVLGHVELGTTQIYAEVDRSRARQVMIEAG